MTCSNQGGIKACHPRATTEFASGRVHAYGTKAKIVAGNSGLSMENQAKNLVVKRAKAEIPEDEILHYNILKIVRLFYQILIALVISFMCVHQLLDYIRAKKRVH
jgi:hypothetical protein